MALIFINQKSITEISLKMGQVTQFVELCDCNIHQLNDFNLIYFYRFGPISSNMRSHLR